MIIYSNKIKNNIYYILRKYGKKKKSYRLRIDLKTTRTHVLTDSRRALIVISTRFDFTTFPVVLLVIKVMAKEES